MRFVPGKAAQWVLLATDTEFRIEEAQLLDATGAWGKLYFLEADEQGNTVIRERQPNPTSFSGYISTRSD